MRFEMAKAFKQTTLKCIRSLTNEPALFAIRKRAILAVVINIVACRCVLCVNRFE